ncbi:hypothetical protein HDU76_006641 [Blyttiomyces sp. JEL0837]|nr:hypothetical protein HDU76_006641 [Blyttiomyces sp. JEL0837]
MEGVARFVMSKADPISFLGGSVSDTKVDPYSVPISSATSIIDRRNNTTTITTTIEPIDTKGTTTNLNDFDSMNGGVGGEGSDITSFLIETYTFSVVTGPLEVVQTLAEVQVQRRDDGDDSDSELAAYEMMNAADPKRSSSSVDKIPLLNGGVWDNARDIVECRSEGWMTLVKGHLTGFIYNASYLFMQPALEETLNDAFDVFDDINPFTNVFSHMVVGGILSPIELVKTRIIVQSNTYADRKYYGPLHALAAITAEEGGGLTALYNPSHLIPTLIIHGIKAILRISTLKFVTQDLGLSHEFNPILHRMSVLGLMLIEVGIIAPFELARKRLQVQRLRLDRRVAGEAAQPFSGSVEMSGRVYKGVFDVLKSVVTEEGASSRSSGASSRSSGKRRKNKSKVNVEAKVRDSNMDWQDLYESPVASAGSSGTVVAKGSRSGKSRGWMQQYAVGVTSLYRGFWARYVVEVVKFAFAELRENDDMVF